MPFHIGYRDVNTDEVSLKMCRANVVVEANRISKSDIFHAADRKKGRRSCITALMHQEVMAGINATVRERNLNEDTLLSSSL